MGEDIGRGSPLPKVIGFRIKSVELAGYVVCSRDVLVEAVGHLRIWRSLEDELSGASRSIHSSAPHS